MTASEKALIQRDVGQLSGRHHPIAGLLKAVRDRRVLGMAVSNFCVICGIYTVSFWLPSIVKAAGVSGTIAIGLWSALPYAASIMAMYLLTRHSDLVRERRRHSAFASMLGGVTLLLATVYASQLAVSMTMITIATAMMWASYTVLWAMPGDYLKGDAAPGGIAFINVLGVLGGFFSPVIIGNVKLATGNMQYGMYVMVALLFVGAITMLINQVPAPRAHPLLHHKDATATFK